MKNEPYLGGRGIMRTTHDLNDRAWITLLGAYLGAILIIFALTAGLPSWLTVPGVVIGWAFVLLWVKAFGDVAEHTSRMESETEKRGEGWADS